MELATNYVNCVEVAVKNAAAVRCVGLHSIYVLIKLLIDK